jgi:hypothetical protein
MIRKDEMYPNTKNTLQINPKEGEVKCIHRYNEKISLTTFTL